LNGHPFGFWPEKGGSDNLCVVYETSFLC